MEDNIVGFPGYHITKEGVLYKYGKPVKVFYHKRYLRCKIRNKNTSLNVKIHRLVAMAYIPNPNNLPLVMHIDDNPFNNHVDNLKWGTHSENLQSAIKNGKRLDIKGVNNPCYGKSGSNNPNSKLTKEDRKRIHKLHLQGKTARYIRNKYFWWVCEETIRRTINKKLK